MVKKNLHVPIGGLDTEKDTVLLNGYYEGIFSRRLNGLSFAVANNGTTHQLRLVTGDSNVFTMAAIGIVAVFTEQQGRFVSSAAHVAHVDWS